jgi:hypothetical protein
LKFARSWSPSQYLQTPLHTASKCISKLACLRPPSVSPNLHNYDLQVGTIMASKCIPKLPWSRLVLATVQTRQHSSRLGLESELNYCNGLYHTKTQTIAIGPVLPPKTQHFNIAALAPIQYLSSDRIMTWSVRRLSSSSCTFTCRCQICDTTNTRCDAIEHLRISLYICPYFTAIQQISARSQIEKREMKERIELHNLHTDHITIQSEIWYLIGTKVWLKL